MITEYDKKTIQDDYANGQIDLILYNCCKNGELEKLEYILEKKFYSPSDFNNDLVMTAVENNHKDVMNYLIKNARVYQGVEVHVAGSAIEACFNYNRLEDLESLLLQYPRGQHVANIPKFFKNACHHGSLDVIKFILKQDFYKDLETLTGFLTAWGNSKWNVIEYFIFDFRIENSNVFTALDEKIPKMFAQRDLNDRLAQDLSSKETHKKVKI